LIRRELFTLPPGIAAKIGLFMDLHKEYNSDDQILKEIKNKNKKYKTK